MQRINLIGPGRVGETLLRCLLTRPAYAVQDICGRDTERSRRIAKQFGGTANDVETARPADIWLLTVPDGDISHIATQLAKRDLPAATAIHFSGFHSAQVMAPLAERGWQTASAHPNLSFADPATAALQFAGTLVGVEGSGAGVATALMTSLGAQCFPISADSKVLYHAAAVVSNNFTTVLQAVAHQLWAEAGVSDAVARKLGEGLTRAAAENVTAFGPAQALTGPAARGDKDVVQSEAETLSAWNTDAGELYAQLSQCAARLKKTGTPF